MTENSNTGHGHVFKRPDGMRARCGGPAICKECARDAMRKKASFDQVPSASNQPATGKGTAILKALDALALALTEHSHVWTIEQRQLYEHAVILAKQV